MMKYAVIGLLLGLTGCSAPEGEPQEDQRAPPPSERTPRPSGLEACSTPVKDPQRISIAALLANPERFEGKSVYVVGYYRTGFEHSAIYLNRDDATHGITANGLWLQARIPSDLRNQYIGVEGIFTGLSRGHLSQWPGTICRVIRVTPLGPPRP